MKILITSIPLLAAAMIVLACLPTAPAVSSMVEPTAYMLHLEEIGPSSGV